MRNKIIPFENNGNIYAIAQNRWAYYPQQNIDTRQSATFPRLSAEGSNNNTRNSDFWVVNGNFFRLRNIEIGYNFILLSNKINARVFVNGMNLWSWSTLANSYKIDPEVFNGYPLLKSVTTGLKISF